MACIMLSGKAVREGGPTANAVMRLFRDMAAEELDVLADTIEIVRTNDTKRCARPVTIRTLMDIGSNVEDDQ